MRFIIGFIIFIIAGTAQANISLGVTRVVFNEGSKDVTLFVRNSSKETPFLVQSWVSDPANSDKATDQFLLTPPLFRMGAGEENLLRIVDTSSSLPADRESLFRINVKAIPPAPDKDKAGNTLQIALKTTIKLFYRPAFMKAMKLEDEVAKVSWRAAGDKVTLLNPTPFNIALTKVTFNGTQSVETQSGLPAKGELAVTAPKKGISDIEIEYINDYGGVVKKKIKKE
ncbi:fimbrial biogenesis chaperone [Pantoea sp. C2G6]|uniref:fimbrial biogenesis chaperone n=1 Tax=Pantoea sp. C2G6 TaxID=3243084 RepID=UPI003ED8D768